MPFDGSGNFSRLYSWQSDRDNGIRILASKMDGEFDNFAAGMNVVFFRNGLVPMSGNLNMGQNYLYGIGAGSVGSPSVRFGDDPNSGLYLNGLGKPALVANGVNRLEGNSTGVAVTGTLNSSGNLSEAGSRVWTAATLTPGDYMPKTGGVFTGSVAFGNDVNFSLQMIGGNPILIADAGSDLMGYNRALNFWDFTIGGTSRANISATGLNVIGAITQNGSQVWHAGNFTPGNYAPLAGATFTGAVTFAGAMGSTSSINAASGYQISGNNALTAAAGTTNLWAGTSGLNITNAAGTLALATVSTSGALNTQGAITQNGSQVWHAGNFNPANYAALTGAVFTGGVQAPSIAMDANCYFTLSGGASILNFDAGDYYSYTRATNRFSWVIGSTEYMALTAGNVSIGAALNATGAITQGGNQVWHAGNFNPANYAALSGAAFTGAVSSSSTISATGAMSSSGNVSAGGAALNPGAFNRVLSVYNSATAALTIATDARTMQIGTIGADATTALGIYDATAAAYRLKINTSGVVEAPGGFTRGGGAVAYQSTTGLSAAMSRGTAAPTGGSDGDMYFQYT